MVKRKIESKKCLVCKKHLKTYLHLTKDRVVCYSCWNKIQNNKIKFVKKNNRYIAVEKK